MLELPRTRWCDWNEVNKDGGSCPQGQSLLRYQPVRLWYHYRSGFLYNPEQCIFVTDLSRLIAFCECDLKSFVRLCHRSISYFDFRLEQIYSWLGKLPSSLALHKASGEALPKVWQKGESRWGKGWNVINKNGAWRRPRWFELFEHFNAHGTRVTLIISNTISQRMHFS